MTSHTKHFPEDHGIRVNPSGLFPSVLERPEGSFMEGTQPRCSARQIISLRLWCRLNLAADREQTELWKPLESTKVPQGQVWGSQMFAPRRRPTQTLRDSSSRRRPQAERGRAKSQSLLCGADTASNRALSCAGISGTRRVSQISLHTLLSQLA